MNCGPVIRAERTSDQLDDLLQTSYPTGAHQGDDSVLLVRTSRQQ